MQWRAKTKLYKCRQAGASAGPMRSYANFVFAWNEGVLHRRSFRVVVGNQDVEPGLFVSLEFSTVAWMI